MSIGLDEIREALTRGSGTMTMVLRFIIVGLIASLAGCASPREQYQPWEETRIGREMLALDAEYKKVAIAIKKLQAKRERERQMGEDPQAWAAYADELEREGSAVSAASARARARYLARKAECLAIGDLRHDPVGRMKMPERCITYYKSFDVMSSPSPSLEDLERRIEDLEAKSWRLD